MSWNEGLHERISIVNVCEATARVVEGLKRYVRSIDHMEKWESVTIGKLALSDGESTVTVGGRHPVGYGCGWVLTPKELQRRQAEQVIWPADHPLMQMLERLDAAREITFEWTISTGRRKLGVEYWKALFGDPELVGRVDHRVMWPDIFRCGTRIVSDDGSGTFWETPCDAPLAVVRDIPKWFAGGFRIAIEGYPGRDRKALKKRMIANHGALLRTVGGDIRLFARQDYAEDSGSVIVESDRLEEFRERLQEYADDIAGFGAEAKFCFDLVPAGLFKGYLWQFAAIRVECVDGKVVMRAGRSDPDF